MRIPPPGLRPPPRLETHPAPRRQHRGDLPLGPDPPQPRTTHHPSGI